jgi:HEAT repeat protein
MGAPALAAAPDLVAALADENGHVRREAAGSLGRLRPGDPQVVQALVRAARDEYPPVRLAAVVALGRLGPPPEAHAELRARLADADEPVRAAARNALAKLSER